MKKFLSALMVCVLTLSTVAFGEADQRIYTDPVVNTYSGRSDGKELISNLNFRDLAADHWAKESVVRSGSLNLVKGYDNSYSPNSPVTNQEAIAFVIRLMNMEKDALEEAVNIKGNYAESETTRNMWSIGYLSLARRLNIITAADFASMTAEEDGEAANDLAGNAPATRERVAHWVAMGLTRISPTALDMNAQIQKTLTFSDWDNIDISYLQSVEAIVRADIMKGDTDGRFKPKAGLTRAEMAQVMRNMDNIYYGLNNFEKKAGTVGGIRNEQVSQTGSATGLRKFYVRNSAGTVDVIQTQLSVTDSSMPDVSLDVVVYKNGAVGGLTTLTEGDQIEYIVDRTTGEALYIQVISPGINEDYIEGKLVNFDYENNQITIEDNSTKKQRTYNMAAGIFGEDYVVIDQAKNSTSTLPIGSDLKLRLMGKTVESISFIGTPVLIDEMRGIVVENDTDYGYLTVVDNNGRMVIKNYYADSIKVEKQQYYDLDDEIGYLDEIFPNFEYDPRDGFIEDIEPGDIVFMRFDPDDNDVVVNISASTNYVAKYGKIRQITRGEGVSRFLIEYENKQTNWFDVADNIFVSKLGKPVDHNQVAVGDWAKFLVNQAIIQPGYIMESVKEINVEGGEHFISTIMKGQMAGIDPVQKKLMVQNAQTLAKTGWSNYQNVQQISIANNDIEYYYNGQRISLDYAERFLKRSDGEVYIALENSASGERAKVVTFRNGRDELLPADTVMTADGNGSFAILSNNGDISTDVGTIVVRHGRLVDSNNILPSDYTVVSLNGANTAAVVEIKDAPDISGVAIARGRIMSVDQGESFKVQSMSVLSGNDWVYTPVQREFTIDYNTKIITSEGLVNYDSLKDYTSETSIDKVYNIVYDGTKATWVVDAPYSKYAVRGTVYEANGETILLRNAEHYDNTTGKWTPVSLKDATMSVTVSTNTIYAKNNSIVNSVGVGDTVRVFTTALPEKMVTGVNVNGYIILVDK